MSLLALRDVEVAYQRRGRGPVRAVAGASLDVERGQVVGLVGESGCGKSSLARAAVGLVAPSAGEIRFEDEPVSVLRRRARPRREARLQMVFQNPYASLNPRHHVRSAITRPLRVLRRLSRRDAEREVGELLERVRLPKRLADRFPGELSGGERQRVALARALAAQPDLLICDEVTSALDVSVQAAVLELLQELRRDLDLSMLFITHNLGVVACIADTVLVMNQGRLCETGPVDRVLSRPADEYTRRLLDAAPSLGEAAVAAPA